MCRELNSSLSDAGRMLSGSTLMVAVWSVAMSAFVGLVGESVPDSGGEGV